MNSKDTESKLDLVTKKDGEVRVDSRDLAAHLGVQHQSTFELLKDYREDFEQLGLIRFETGIINGRGKPQKFALLNEDQCYLLLTYSRNTARVRELKVRLVKAFGEARRMQDLTKVEYLPTYHALHDDLKALAASSSNPRYVHMNMNKLINKTAGIDAGHRGDAPIGAKSMLVTAQMIARRALQKSRNHRDGYASAKAALDNLAALALGGVDQAVIK